MADAHDDARARAVHYLYAARLRYTIAA
eukprot:COSAG02_NODE_67924_length_251_cov_29.750000_1_plen_27_part_10